MTLATDLALEFARLLDLGETRRLVDATVTATGRIVTALESVVVMATVTTEERRMTTGANATTTGGVTGTMAMTVTAIAIGSTMVAAPGTVIWTAMLKKIPGGGGTTVGGTSG